MGERAALRSFGSQGVDVVVVDKRRDATSSWHPGISRPAHLYCTVSRSQTKTQAKTHRPWPFTKEVGFVNC